MAERSWRRRPGDPDAAARLASELSLSPRLARLLVSREVDSPDAAARFLEPTLATGLRSPRLFRQMPAAVARLLTALDRNERIALHGDYDVDGVSGTAVLLTFLRALGHEPIVHLPHRMRDGYGVTERGIRQIADRGATLLVTIDCGAASHREIALAKELGIDTIVCDHHQVSGIPLGAVAVLNPIEPDAGFPFRGLCGAGVAFYLASGVRQELRDRGHPTLPDLRRYLDLVTLGTIADVVPLREENRALVKFGLREILQTTRPGLAALKAVSRVDRVDAASVGFRLAPRLNAGGRLDDAGRSLELLTTADPTRAESLARELDEENQRRREVEQEILQDAIARVGREDRHRDRRTIVLASEDWHPGVIGIVAARLVERFHRPTVLIALDASTGTGRGSGRTVRGVHLQKCFAACAEHLLGSGGHEMAAGLSIEAGRVDGFAEAFESAVVSSAGATASRPEILVDDEVSLTEVNENLLAEVSRLEPFGAGNPEPVFCLRQAEVLWQRPVGASNLRLRFGNDRHTIDAIGFRFGDRQVQTGAVYDVLFSLQVNDWGGRQSVEMRLVDLRPARGSAPAEVTPTSDLPRR